MKSPFLIIKIGGKIYDDIIKLSSFLKSFAVVPLPKILIHGGGKMATKVAEQLNIPQQMVNGRRVTNAETLKVVTMVYAGFINKDIVVKLQAYGCNAIGLTGTDANLIVAHKRSFKNSISGETGDYGFAGDIDEVNTPLLTTFIEQGLTPVIAPITHDKEGQLLNTNADTIAKEIAKALSLSFDVQLIYLFEKAGVLGNAADERSVIQVLTPKLYETHKQKGTFADGMIPKLENAFAALNNGVKKVVIGNAENFNEVIAGTSGTTIINE